MDTTHALALPNTKPTNEDDFYAEHGQGAAVLWAGLTERRWILPRLRLRLASPRPARPAYTCP